MRRTADNQTYYVLGHKTPNIRDLYTLGRKLGQDQGTLLVVLVQVIAESLSEEEIAGLREMFQAMDTDSSGAITFDELKAGLRRYGSTLKDTEIRDLMEAVRCY
ncbi:hypothetical protein RYX36_005323 [Vicia faba]